MILQLDNVSLRTYLGNTLLLNDISFTLDRGDRLAVVGASGAGKTLLLRLFNRLADPTEGRILFEGRPLSQIPVLELRRQVVLVLQESKLLEMTVADAIAYPLQLRGLKKSQIQQRVDTWCDRLQLPSEWLGKTELELSVGQRQLVAIARGLVTEPQVLLLDEPTSALDVGRSLELMLLLVKLAETQGTTIVMTNHQLDFARQFASRVLHLEAGRVVSDVSGQAADWDEIQQQLIAVRQRETAEWGEASDLD